MLVAAVAVEGAAYHFDKAYDYAIPPQLAQNLAPGCRVLVGFGAGKGRRTGLVLALHEREEATTLKPVLQQLDAAPILNDEQRMLLEHLRQNTFCTYFEALRVLLPAGLGLKATQVYTCVGELPDDLPPRQLEIARYLAARRAPCPHARLEQALGIPEQDADLAALLAEGIVTAHSQLRRRVQDERQLMLRLLPPGEHPKKPTPKAQAVIDLLEELGQASVRELCYYCGVTRAVTDRMVAAGLAEYYEEQSFRTPYSEQQAPPPATTLSAEQQQAADALCVRLQSGGSALLYGVTGSGKTRVYLQLIEQVLAAGRQALVLVPEISLTPQMVQFFKSRFGEKVAVMHSSLSLGERLDEYRRIAAGLCSIAVGTRSAVFAPLTNLGLLVVDEEQEQTYRSEASPRFDAREIAALRAKWHGGLLLLASATPSVESYHTALRTGSMVTLGARYGSAQLPRVEVVDMRQPELAGSGSLSLPLLDELERNLAVGEQSILLLNRRGHSTQVKCLACGSLQSCPACDIPLTYHAANERLVCHYCGYSRPRPQTCPECGGGMIRLAGLGTQRIEEQLTEIFPKAGLLRLDADTTLSKFSLDKHLQHFGGGKYDIMIGTQMVAKGLDFPKVTLVGVLNADQALYSPDFRSFERSFSLITQVVGRCGRGELAGRAVIQTYSPENPVIALAAAQLYPEFFEEELASRRLHLYPPFCRLYCIGFAGEQQQAVQQAAFEFAQRFAQEAAAHYPGMPVRLLGPAPSPTPKVAGRWRWRLLLKCRRDKNTHALLSTLLCRFGQNTAFRGVSVSIDPNY